MIFLEKLNFIEASLILYILCLFLPAFYISGNNPSAWSLGLGLLFIGWIGDISWFANPLLFVSWIFYKYKKFLMAALCALLALGFSLSFLTTENLVVSTAPHYADVTSYGVGYYAWIISIACALVASFSNYKSLGKV